MMIYILITDKECNDDAFPVREDCEVDTVCGEAICHHNQYVTCHVNRCGTCEPVFRGYDNITVNCTQCKTIFCGLYLLSAIGFALYISMILDI